MIKAALVLGILAFGACSTSSSAPTEAAPPDGSLCGDSAFFTACVHQCGEVADSEPISAECVGGTFHCEAPLTPASDCPAGSWTSSRLPCGPWPGTYNCGLGCAVCDSTRGWTCGICADAGP